MNGTAHRFCTAILVAPVAYGAYYIAGSTIMATAAGLGTAVGMLVTPDMDLADNPKNVMHYPFYFYGKIVKHRSLLSHGPVISTVGRILYIAFLLWPVWLALGRPAINVDWTFLAWMFVGLAIADAAHYICDFAKADKKVVRKQKFSPWLYNQ